jgi:hypothetical protein
MEADGVLCEVRTEYNAIIPLALRALMSFSCLLYYSGCLTPAESQMHVQCCYFTVSVCVTGAHCYQDEQQFVALP